jgi:hypothetical protein
VIEHGEPGGNRAAVHARIALRACHHSPRFLSATLRLNQPRQASARLRRLVMRNRQQRHGAAQLPRTPFTVSGSPEICHTNTSSSFLSNLILNSLSVEIGSPPSATSSLFAKAAKRPGLPRIPRDQESTSRTMHH